MVARVPKKPVTKQRVTRVHADEQFDANGAVSGRIQRPKPGQADARATLEQIAADPNIPATARASAARTLLEMDGAIGKHQAAPGSDTAAVPLSQATRAELEAELTRLRAAFAARAT